MIEISIDNNLKQWKSERACELKNEFEQHMDDLVGYPNNEATRCIAQEALCYYVKQMEGIGWRMKRATIPYVNIDFEVIQIVPIEFEEGY